MVPSGVAGVTQFMQLLLIRRYNAEKFDISLYVEIKSIVLLMLSIGIINSKFSGWLKLRLPMVPNI
ncbi:hypothetical protein TMES_12145 [Thalassospira mesophila]|uniref:Uncharacterized protein n=1 Tax=Thalassospira mesophila TaxID=1293891 RepID=A0A1Y2KYT3_9PROT|nr:hypothetical protein TMES_12145 [Thalassospira mesophila]